MEVRRRDMDFRNRKLPKEATSRLRRCPIETVKPYALMIAPVYVYMRRNEKFISVKAPLDFFTHDELERLKSVELFFMPEFVDSVLPYRGLARRTKILLGWNPVEAKETLPPTPYELSDAILRMTAPLWGREFQIESFFVSVYVNELCALLPAEALAQAREKDLTAFERAIIISAWMVFLSLHIGVADQDFLDRLRLSAFRKVAGLETVDPSVLSLDSYSDTGELYRILEQVLAGEQIYRSLTMEFFKSRSERVSQKIVSRVLRIQGENLVGTAPLQGTIYGERGFLAGGAE